MLMLIGLPEKRDRLSGLQPSLMRIFGVTEVDRLTDQEVEEFLHKSFSSVGIKVTSNAMKTLVKYSSGLPILMHEIGDATFWLDSDAVINGDDAFYGVVEAAGRIGKKYLDPKVYRTIRSSRYRSILRKLGQQLIGAQFTKKAVAAGLDDAERKVFHNFLRKLTELGILEKDIEAPRGTYRFVNDLYYVYIFMESIRAEKENQ